MMHFFKLKKFFLVNITNNKINNENIKEQSIDISLLFYKKKKINCFIIKTRYLQLIRQNK